VSRRRHGDLVGFRASISRRAHAAFVVAGLSLLFGGWVFIERYELLPHDFFPGPADVFHAAVTMFGKERFHLHVLASVARVGTAFLVSAILAIPLGLLMSSFRPIRGVFEPLVEFVRYVPVPSLVPIFVLWTGVDETTKFLVLFFGTFFQLVLLVMDDADHVPQIYFDIARTLGASTRQLVRDVLVPYLRPQIYDNLRVTLGWCWTYLVIAELVAVDWGMGRTIKEAQRFNAADQLFVCFIVLGFIGLVTDALMARGHRRLFPYSVKSRVEGGS
jgi:NitT/TauT family transport system permease protein